MADYEASIAFLGEWGRFQKQVFFLLCLSLVSNGFGALAIVFLAATPSHHCLVPARVNLTAAWRASIIPLEEESGALAPSKCSRYKLDHVLGLSESGLLPGVDVNLTGVPTEGCLDGWEYDRSVYLSTITTEWDLVCDDRWKNPMTASVFFLGCLIGCLISGQISDRYGRKKVLFVCMAMQTVFSILQFFSTSWIGFCALFFFFGMGLISKYMVAFVLGSEIFGPRVRTIYSTAGVSLFFSAGYIMLPLLAFFIRGWRILVLGLNLTGFLYVPLWGFIPESPRWLLSQGRVEEAEAIVRDAAKRNKIKPPLVIFSPLQFPPQHERPSEKKTTHNICDVLSSRNIRRVSLTLWVIWSTTTIVYYVLSLNTANLHGNAYFNCFLSAVVEVPAYILSWGLYRWVSGRLCLFSTLFLGGLSLLCIQLVPAHLIHFATIFEMLGKFAVSVTFTIIFAFTTELYPTLLRNTALGACAMASRIGSIVAPYILYLRSYWVSLPYILIGSLTVLTGLLSLLLPNNFGMPLPETIAHMQHFPGCCQKPPYTATHTEEDEEIRADRTSAADPQTRSSPDI